MIQIVPDIFEFAFREIVRNSVAEAAELDIEIIPVKMKCMNCGSDFQVKENRFACNICSSTGAGKTTLLERTCEELGGKFRIGVIEGDITTDRDAQRLKKYNIPIVVINTEGGCHLDSYSISKVLDSFDLDNLDVLFVENVGNLICPSQFDLGETFKLAVVSTTEGDDKPGKYPMLFREARAVLLNKIDLIPYTNFNSDSFKSDLIKINSQIPLFEVSCTRGDGMNEWYEWISEKVIVSR